MTSFSIRFFIFLLLMTGSNAFGVKASKNIPHATVQPPSSTLNGPRPVQLIPNNL
jgi:hypothetical protein